MPNSFRVGEKVVYPACGVGEVVALTQREVAGRVENFYELRLLGGSRVLVPVERAGELGLRGVVGRQAVRQIMEILRGRGERLEKQSWNRRQQALLEKIRSGSAFDLAEVLRDLTRLRSTKVLSLSERHLLETSRARLVHELAAARGETADAIEKQLDRIIGVGRG